MNRLHKMRTWLLLAGLSFGAVLAAADYSVMISTDKPDGFYQKDETIVYSFNVTGKDGKPAEAAEVTVTVQSDGQPQLTKEIVKITDGKGELKVKPTQPGWTYVTGQIQEEIKPASEKQKPRIVAKSNKAEAGAIMEKDKVRRAAPMPDDFDAFWDAEIAKLKEVPMNPKLEELPVAEKDKDKIRLWKVTLDCVGPRPAQGYLSMPKDAKPKSLPIIMMYDGAGMIQCGPSSWYGDVAISLTFNKYGIPNEKDKLKEYWKSDVEGYQTKGCDNRDEIFFKWMILRNLRAQEFAKSLPEWNGKVMVINGESLGGAQSLICGALDPDVTFICACVPALGDQNGEEAKRCNGWPQVLDQLRRKNTDDAEMKKASDVIRYIDTANFMHRLNPKTEVSIGTGLLDTVVPPTAQISVFNEIPAANVKTQWFDPKAGHGAGNKHGAQRILDILGKL